MLSSTRVSSNQALNPRTSIRESSYTSHTAYTFGENKPIWVVSNSKCPLHAADDLKDMWADAQHLPGYSSRNQEEVRTSVMHPLRKEGRAFGVVDFAAEKYVEPTPASLEEIRTLATLISRACQMFDVPRVQRENTKRVMQMLEEALTTQDWSRLALRSFSSHIQASSGLNWKLEPNTKQLSKL